MKQLREHKRTIEERVLEQFRGKLSPAFYKILECQLKNCNRKPQGYRYSTEMKVINLGIHQSGPKCYRGLPIIKPGKQTVRRTLKKLKFQPGVNKVTMDALQTRANGMSDRDKQVVVGFDEMSLRVYFEYDSANDRVIGWVDLGNGKRLSLPGEEAMVVMVRSLFGQWKQPIAFWFSHRKLSAEHFRDMFLSAIQAIQDTGLVVRVVVTDGLSKNKVAFEMLGATLQNPSINVRGAKIYTLFDVPHLIKSLRNALLSYPLLLPSGEMVYFQYIEQVCAP